MSIYRGAGGSGDATADSSSEALLIRELAVEVQADADAAAASATAAGSSASSASTSATNAATSATAAASSASSASTSASNAATSATAAQTAETNAETAQTAAELAETNAETAETNAETAATSAASSASTATTQASNASTSATAAASSATAAASSASSASTSATNAASSATSAAGSATSASNSASSASTSASNAATSETNAASSASSASTSATNAASSATSAAGSATTATTQAGLAATSASNAATSETNAAASETNAAASASSASTSATNAANSATSAATSATNAANSATLAASYTPSQAGNAGKFLTTDGTNTSWDTLATVANSGAYSDLSGTPTLATVATSGSYNDLSNKPTIPTNLDSLTDVTITTPSTDQILKYNGSGWVNGAASSAYNGMKNRIINGAMVIDQRNAGASVTPSNNQYLVDRWKASLSASSKFSVQQNAGSVTPPAGFKNYLGVTSLSAYTVGTNESFALQQPIEGFNTADLDFGTANAKTVTLSFWVRSSLTGTFGGSIWNGAVNRLYPFTYTISAANTWEQKTITIAGDTTGTWVGATNGIGMFVNILLGAGSGVSGTANAWGTGSSYYPTGATSVVGTNGATFYITGVQLEVGSSATGFEYRQYGQELALCQAYYETGRSWAGGRTTDGVAMMTASFKVTKRATPTMAYTSVLGGAVTGYAAYTNMAQAYNSAGTNSHGECTWTASAEL